MTVVILCAGESKRFTWEGMSKFRLPVFHGEELIQRTVRQCIERGKDPHVICHTLELFADVPIPIRVFEPFWHGYTCQTLLSTISLWQDQVTVLLGDTLYSDEIMDAILNTRSSFLFWGSDKRREIYSVTFADHQYVQRAIEKVTERVHQGYHGQLWQLFYVLNNLPAHRHPDSLPYQVFRNVNDLTRDFDTKEDYEKFRREVLDKET